MVLLPTDDLRKFDGAIWSRDARRGIDALKTQAEQLFRPQPPEPAPSPIQRAETETPAQGWQPLTLPDPPDWFTPSVGGSDEFAGLQPSTATASEPATQPALETPSEPEPEPEAFASFKIPSLQDMTRGWFGEEARQRPAASTTTAMPTAEAPPDLGRSSPGEEAAGAVQPDTSSPDAFLSSVTPAARAAARAAGLPDWAGDIAAGVASNETGYGKAVAGNNFFGIKGSNPTTGANTGPVDTWEVENGQRVNTQDTFRAYGTPGESFDDFFAFLRDNPRYATALKAQDPTSFIKAIHGAGYATDPNWSNQVLSIAGKAAGVPGTAPSATRAPIQTGPTTPTAPPQGDSPYDIAFDYDQPYGDAQFNPDISRHRGVDLVVRGAEQGGRGTAVGAFQGGTVAALTQDPNGGNGVIIQTPDGLYNRYFHLDSVGVKQGQQLAPGETIGALGATGTEGFPHVHFEVSKGLNGDPVGQTIDPRPYMAGTPAQAHQEQHTEPLLMSSGDAPQRAPAGQERAQPVNPVITALQAGKGARLPGVQAYEPASDSEYGAFDPPGYGTGPQPGDFPGTPPAEPTYYPTGPRPGDFPEVAPAEPTYYQPPAQAPRSFLETAAQGLNDASAGLMSGLNQTAANIGNQFTPRTEPTAPSFESAGPSPLEQASSGLAEGLNETARDLPGQFSRVYDEAAGTIAGLPVIGGLITSQDIQREIAAGQYEAMRAGVTLANPFNPTDAELREIASYMTPRARAQVLGLADQARQQAEANAPRVDAYEEQNPFLRTLKGSGSGLLEQGAQLGQGLRSLADSAPDAVLSPAIRALGQGVYDTLHAKARENTDLIRDQQLYGGQLEAAEKEGGQPAVLGKLAELLQDPAARPYLVENTLPSTIRNVLEWVGVGLATRASPTGGIASAAAKLPALGIFLSEAGGVYDTAVRAGQVPAKAAQLANLNGVVNAAIEFTPWETFGKIWSRARGGTPEAAIAYGRKSAARSIVNAARSVGIGALTEGLEEAGQNTVSNLAERTYNGAKDVWDGLAAATFGGALGGGAGAGGRQTLGASNRALDRAMEPRIVHASYDPANRAALDAGNQPVAEPRRGQATWASSVNDPTQRYEFHYEVRPLDELVTSHTDAFAPNRDFPRELQPRLRDRAASRVQINEIAAKLSPDALLAETHRLDSGVPIVGPDGIVESGNGRTMALRLAAREHPERFAEYQQALRAQAEGLGIDPAALDATANPVLVRVRDSEVDRPRFAAEANQATVLDLSAHERAAQDARRLTPETLSALQVSETQSIDQALLSGTNRDVVRGIVATIPANERAGMMTANGELSASGLQRVKNTLFAATYPGEVGQRLARVFLESPDPGIRNVQNGMFASLPAMARTESLIRTGERAPDLSLSDDLAAAVNALDYLRHDGTSVQDYLGQSSMFERELTPVQEQLLGHLDSLSRSPRRIRDFIQGYADAVQSEPNPNQTGLFGEVPRTSKGELIDRASGGATDAAAAAEQPAQPGLLDLGDAAGGRHVGEPTGAPQAGAAPQPGPGLAEPRPRALSEETGGLRLVPGAEPASTAGRRTPETLADELAARLHEPDAPTNPEALRAALDAGSRDFVRALRLARERGDVIAERAPDGTTTIRPASVDDALGLAPEPLPAGSGQQPPVYPVEPAAARGRERRPPRQPRETAAERLERRADSAAVADEATSTAQAAQGEPFTHAPGSGYVGDASPGTQAALERSTGQREYGNVSREDSHAAGVALALDQRSMAALDQRLQREGGTRRGAAEVDALRERAVGAVENVQGLQADVDRLRRMAEAGEQPDIADQLTTVEKLLKAAQDSAALSLSSSRRYAEAAGRTLGQFQYRISAQAAQKVAARIDQLAGMAKRARLATDVRPGRRLDPRQLADLEGLADQLDRDGSLLQRNAPAVRAVQDRIRQTSEGQGRAHVPRGEPSLAERLGVLEREHAAAHGDDAGQVEIGQRRDALLEEIRAAADERARAIADAGGRDPRDLTPEEIERAVNQAIGGPTVSTANREALQAERQARGTPPEQDPIRALIEEIKAGERVAVTDDRATVGYWMKAALDHPEDAGIREAMHEAIDRVGTHGEKGKKLAVQLRQQFSGGLTKSYDRLMQGVERRNEQAAVKDRATIERVIDRLTVQDMTAEARDVMRQIAQFPDDAGFKGHFQTLMDDMRLTGERGATAANQLAAQLEKRTQQSYETLMAGVTRRNAEQVTGDMAASERNFDTLRVRELAQEIRDFASAARRNPDLLAVRDLFGDSRLSRLQEDLMLVGKQGTDRASSIREQMFKAGILHLAQKRARDMGDDQLDGLVRALGNVQTPEELGTLVRAIRQPRLLDYLYEVQYVNMLSSPVTHLVNAAANTAQLAGRLAFNPLTVAGDVILNPGNRQTSASEVGAAIRGAGAGLAEGLRGAGHVMRTGERPGASQQAIELGNLSGMNREFLTERFGPLGVALHAVSSRPLEAMDVLLGHMAYSSAAEQGAVRQAVKLRREGDASVQGMSLQEATDHVRRNIWDHPDVLAEAGKVRDYTLLRGSGNTQLERWLRQGAALRNAPADAGFARQAGAFVANQALPFFNVPLNYTKQGLDRSLGAPVNTVRMLTEKDPVQRAELFKRAAVGYGVMATAMTLAAGGDLTGDGPTDPDKRALWLADHQPNSVRLPGSTAWHSYQSTPWGIPFAIVAHTMENVDEAEAKAETKGLAPVEQASAIAQGGIRGTVSGVVNQTFLQNLSQMYGQVTGTRDAFPGLVTGTAARFVQPSLVRWYARITDSMERDATHGDSTQEQVGQRLAAGYPGARQMLPPRQNVLGEPVANESAGLKGIVPLPLQGRQGNAPDSPVIRVYQEAGLSIPAPAESIADGRGGKIPLTADETRQWQRFRGESLAEQVPQAQALPDWTTFTPQQRELLLRGLLNDARKQADTQMIRAMGFDTARKRLTPAG